MLALALLSATILFAIWIGYPLVMWIAARLTRTSWPQNEGPLPRVTAVLATREDDGRIRTRVENLLTSDYPAPLLDVVVAIDHSRDPRSVGADLSAQPRLTVVEGDPPAGKAAALNAAVRAAQGDILVFADAAQRFVPETIARLVDELQRRPDMTAVSGALHIAPGEPESPVTRYWRYERWLRQSESAIHSPAGVTGAVYAMRRTAWVPLPAGLILDDLFVPMRQILSGHRVGFRDDAIAIDPRQFSGGKEYHRKSRTLTGVYQLCHLLPDVLHPGRNPIWLQFVCHKLLRLATPLLLVLFLLSAGVWALAALPRQVVPLVVGGTTAVIALGLLASPRLRRTMGEVIAVQAAVVRAARNAWRGEWDVW